MRGERLAWNRLRLRTAGRMILGEHYQMINVSSRYYVNSLDLVCIADHEQCSHLLSSTVVQRQSNGVLGVVGIVTGSLL